VRASNIPIPETHIAALIAAAAMNAVVPLRIPTSRRLGRIAGAVLLMAGAGFAASAVMAAGDIDVEANEALVTSGVYARSGNPMYVGWSSGVLGLAFLTRSGWLLLAWAVAVRALHREIEVEEAQLVDRFGSDYVAYRASVPRYIGSLG
jgi:protein-S-isoprenylcysteine O-methyltransferase Ste14